MKEKDYHCCATCRHIRVSRRDGRPFAMCSRLGYQTQTNWRFDCWDPRDDIRRRMEGQAAAKEVADGEK